MERIGIKNHPFTCPFPWLLNTYMLQQNAPEQRICLPASANQTAMNSAGIPGQPGLCGCPSWTAGWQKSSHVHVLLWYSRQQHQVKVTPVHAVPHPNRKSGREEKRKISAAIFSPSQYLSPHLVSFCSSNLQILILISPYLCLVLIPKGIQRE